MVSHDDVNDPYAHMILPLSYDIKKYNLAIK